MSEHARDQRHAPIPLQWMTAQEVAVRRRFESHLISLAGVAIADARRIGDDHLYQLAREALEDARARWQEYKP